MCFTSDAEWYAAQVSDVTAPATKRTVCDECHQLIHAGEPHRRVEQQEREDGTYCEPDEGRHADGCSGEGDCDHDGPGETFEWDCCGRCDQLLKAIKAAELAEGCGEHESQPNLTELRQAMRDDAAYRDGHYAEHARALFPELALSGHLDRMATPDADDLFEHLASPGGRESGPYAGAVCWDERTASHWQPSDLGGEG